MFVSFSDISPGYFAPSNSRQVCIYGKRGEELLGIPAREMPAAPLLPYCLRRSDGAGAGAPRIFAKPRQDPELVARTQIGVHTDLRHRQCLIEHDGRSAARTSGRETSLSGGVRHCPRTQQRPRYHEPEHSRDGSLPSTFRCGSRKAQPRSLFSAEGSAARRHRPSNSAPCSMANDM